MTSSWNPSADEEMPAGLAVGRPDFGKRGPRSVAGSDRDGGGERKGPDVSRMTKEEREAYMAERFAEKERQKNEAVLAKLGISLDDLPQSRTKSIPAVSSAKPPMREPRERRQSDAATSRTAEAPAAGNGGWGVTEEPSLGARRPEPVDEAPPGFAPGSPPPTAAAAAVAPWSIDAVDSQTAVAVSGWDIPAEPMPKAVPAPQVRREMPEPEPPRQQPSYQPLATPEPAASFGFAVDLVDSQSALAVSGWDVPADDIPSYSRPAYYTAPEPVVQKPVPVPAAAPVAPRTAPAPVPAPAPAKEKEPAMFGFSVDLVSAESSMAVSGWDVPADDFPRAEQPVAAAPDYAQPAAAPVVAPVAQPAAPRPQPQPAPVPRAIPIVESKRVETHPAVDLVDSQCAQAVSGWDVPADDFPRAAPVAAVKPVAPVAIPPPPPPPQPPVQQQLRHSQPQGPSAPVQQAPSVPVQKRQERSAPPAPAAPVVTIAKEQPGEFDSWSVDLVNSQSNGAVSGWDVSPDDFPRTAPANGAGWDVPKPVAAAPQPVQQKAPVQVVGNPGWKIDRLPSEQMNERRPQYSYQNDSPAPSKASAPSSSDHVTCPHCHKGFSLSSL